MAKYRLNIMYVIDKLETNYPRDQNYIVKYMSEKGHDIIVITSYDRNFAKYDSKAFSNNVKIYRCPRIGNIGKATVFIPKKSGLSSEFDVLHAFTFFTYSSIIAPFLYDSRLRVLRSEVMYPGSMNFHKARKQYYILNLMYRRLYDFVTAYNVVEAKSLEMLGFPRGRICLLPIMIDWNKFHSCIKSFEHDEIVIGTIARLSPEKGVHRLPKIMYLLKNLLEETKRKYRFVLAGRIENKKLSKLVIKKLKEILREKFEYLGEIAPPYPFYKKVDIVLIPSLTETGAITVLEAMAAGKVVIASDIYPINLYIQDRVSGFLFRNEHEAAKILSEILRGKYSIQTLQSKAINYAKRHDYNTICAKLENIYYKGLSSKHSKKR